ncbi:unnamed protein product [Cercopithifilaria johnstoni]|uniref:Uncharacterized protein n=1 Tax=Cercopithifilaria johnstoni TaxID=2874296 RepID=A0A8J2LRT4_9BILA|nr:unnamed protein product [Cercopithifilaria johnstoni]
MWPPYEMYNPFYISDPYQGLGYGGGCTNIILSRVPCQQSVRQWNMYPDYQSPNYNTRSYSGIIPRIFVPYGSDNIMPQTNGITMDLLNRAILLDNAEAATIGSSALAPKLLGANILNDKNRFAAHGCSYDTNHSRCADNFNLCKGKCKNFGDNVTDDCRCVPEDLLAILGLTMFRK